MSINLLKWENDTIGYIDTHTNEVEIIKPNLNKTVVNIFQGKRRLTAYEWYSFLDDRIVSSARRDIEKVLFRLGLSRYDVFKIANAIRAINVKDRCWIAFNSYEKYEDCVVSVLNEIVSKSRDIDGNFVHSPSGQRVKRYGVYKGKFGIYKDRLNPIATDVESEVAVSLLGSKMGISCCPVIQVGKNTVFSEFMYDFNKESIVHFRSLFIDGERGDSEVENILKVRPQYKTPLFQMLVLDFITNQSDRHLSNFAVKVTNKSESFYPLYDNGDSLFFVDDEALVTLKCSNPVLYSESFGPVGTQWDAICDMVKEGNSLFDSVNLGITDEEIEVILEKANFKGYRYDGAKVFIRKSIELLKDLKSGKFRS